MSSEWRLIHLRSYSKWCQLQTDLLSGWMIIFSSSLLLFQQHCCSQKQKQMIKHLTDLKHPSQSVSFFSQSLWRLLLSSLSSCCFHRSRLCVDWLLARCCCVVGFTCCRRPVSSQCPWGAERERRGSYSRPYHIHRYIVGDIFWRGNNMIWDRMYSFWFKYHMYRRKEFCFSDFQDHTHNSLLLF